MKQLVHKSKIHLGQDGKMFIHLPKEVCEHWNLAAGDELEWTVEHVMVYLTKVRK